MLSGCLRAGIAWRWRSRGAGHRVQCGSSLRPPGASELPAGCCEQASRMTPAWSWISVSSSPREGYDEPEIPLPQAVSFVSQVLKRDSINIPRYPRRGVGWGIRLVGSSYSSSFAVPAGLPYSVRSRRKYRSRPFIYLRTSIGESDRCPVRT